MNRLAFGLVFFCMPVFAADTQWLCLSEVAFTLGSSDGKYVGKAQEGGEKFVVTAKGVKIAGKDDYLKISDSSPMTCDVKESVWDDGTTSIYGVECSFQGAHNDWGWLEIETNTLSFEARINYENSIGTYFFGHCTAL